MEFFQAKKLELVINFLSFVLSGIYTDLKQNLLEMKQLTNCKQKETF